MSTREDLRWMQHGVTGVYVYAQCCTLAGRVVDDETVWHDGEVWGESGMGDFVWWDRDHAEEVVARYRTEAPRDSNEMHQSWSARNVVAYLEPLTTTKGGD